MQLNLSENTRFSRFQRPSGLRWVAFVVGSMWMLWGCGGPSGKSKEDDQPLSRPENQLVVEDITVLVTSGTTILRNVKAEKAVYHEDSQYLEASTVTLTLNLVNQNFTIESEAARGEVFLKSKKRKEGENEAQRVSGPLGFEGVMEFARIPPEERLFGDIVLHGPVVGRTSTGGTFYTDLVIFSDHLKRLLVPTPYQNMLPQPDGGRMAMTGSAFEVDSTLQEWTFYVENEPGHLVWGDRELPDNLRMNGVVGDKAPRFEKTPRP